MGMRHLTRWASTAMTATRLPGKGGKPFATHSHPHGEIPESGRAASLAEYSRPPRRSADSDDDIHIVQFWAACPQRSSCGDAVNSADDNLGGRVPFWPPEGHGYDDAVRCSGAVCETVSVRPASLYS